jgi:hypothetical protein
MLKDKVIKLPEKKTIDKDVREIFFTRNVQFRNNTKIKMYALSYQKKKSMLVKAVFDCFILKSQLTL